MKSDWNTTLNKYLLMRLNDVEWNTDWLDEDDVKFYLIYDHIDHEFLVSQDVHIQIPGIVYLPESLAEEIYADLSKHKANLENLDSVLLTMTNDWSNTADAV